MKAILDPSGAQTGPWSSQSPSVTWVTCPPAASMVKMWLWASPLQPRVSDRYRMRRTTLTLGPAAASWPSGARSGSSSDTRASRRESGDQA